MSDITGIFLTVNKVPWMKYHNEVMLDAIGDMPLIIVSREEMRLPGIQLRQHEAQSHDNMFRQMLRAAKIATTPFVAPIEDDMLYSRDHFKLRPPLDAFGYNYNRWSLFTFGEPTFSFKFRLCGGTGIFPRQYLIEALEERFAKWPNGIPHHLNGEVGYHIVDRNLGVTVRNSVVLYSSTPLVQIHHVYGTPGFSRTPGANDTSDPAIRPTRKRMGMKRAYEIPKWGRSEELIKHFV